jgi:glutathione reductase (NADPH)
MAKHDYDLFVIGAGSGGVRGARASARYGARVAIAEERYLGGTCVNVGCVPKKLLTYAAHYGEDFREAAGFGWSVGDRSFDWSTLISNKDAEIQRLNGVYAQLLEQSGVTRFEGRARVAGPHAVAIGGKQVSARYVLVATGSWPFIPEVPGAEHAITSNQIFHLEEMPRRAVIVGGGYIAVEFAGILHGLGAQVVQLYRGPLFLRGFDIDLRHTLTDEMRKKGIDLRFEVNVERIAPGEAGLRVAATDGRVLEADQILYATGRRPLTRDLGLEEVGVELKPNGAIAVDEYSQSSVESIFAIGDVTDRIMLTPVAIAEGEALARTLFGGEPTRPDHADVPSAVFSQPPIGTVGLTEEQARAEYDRIDIYRSSFRPLKHTISGSKERSLMKLVVDRDSDRVLGVHVLGPEAGEIVQGFAVAVKMGASKAQFDATIGIHPTSAEELVTLREPAPPGG